MQAPKYTYIRDEGVDCSIMNLREAVYRVLEGGYSDHAVECVVKKACTDRAMHLLSLPREDPDPRRCFNLPSPTTNNQQENKCQK